MNFKLFIFPMYWKSPPSAPQKRNHDIENPAGGQNLPCYVRACNWKSQSVQQMSRNSTRHSHVAVNPEKMGFFTLSQICEVAQFLYVSHFNYRPTTSRMSYWVSRIWLIVLTLAQNPSARGKMTVCAFGGSSSARPSTPASNIQHWPRRSSEGKWQAMFLHLCTKSTTTLNHLSCSLLS